MAIQLATAAGLRVVGTASSEEGRRAVMQAGAEIAFDHSREGYLKEVIAWMPQGFDICVEMLANSNLGKWDGALCHNINTHTCTYTT